MAAAKTANSRHAGTVRPSGGGTNQITSASATLSAARDPRRSVAAALIAPLPPRTRPRRPDGAAADGAALALDDVLPLEGELAGQAGVAARAADHGAGHAPAGRDRLALQLAVDPVAALVGPHAMSRPRRRRRCRSQSPRRGTRGSGRRRSSARARLTAETCRPDARSRSAAPGAGPTRTRCLRTHATPRPALVCAAGAAIAETSASRIRPASRARVMSRNSCPCRIRVSGAPGQREPALVVTTAAPGRSSPPGRAPWRSAPRSAPSSPESAPGSRGRSSSPRRRARSTCRSR